jgi:hypothetical protein
LQRTQRTLEKRVATLRALFNRGVAEAKLLKAAARVRDARIAVIRAKLGELPTPLRRPYHARRIAKAAAEIESLQSISLQVILAEFRSARPAGKSTLG